MPAIGLGFAFIVKMAARSRKMRVLGALMMITLAFGAFGLRWLLDRPMTYAVHQARVGATGPTSFSEEPDEVGLEVLPTGEHPPMLLPVDILFAANVGEAVEPSLPVVPSIRTERAELEFESAENYLLVGIDHTRGTWGRADTIVVAVFDEESGHGGLVSIPRDLYVDIPGHGPARINATLRIAARQGKDPLDVLRGVVEDVLSLEVEHVVVGDLRVFERTVDALGGLDVDVPCPLIDNFIDERTESGRRLLDVEAGLQGMDGATAAMYARSRHGRSDWDRSRRQHAVLSALRRKVREAGMSQWVPVLGAALEQGVITSMSRLELLRLIRRVSRLDEGRLHGLLIGSRQVERHRTAEGRSVLLPNYDAIDEALGGLFEAPAPGIAPRPRRCRPTDIALQHQPRTR
jgi:LCP family protein required for cell wall assembly